MCDRVLSFPKQDLLADDSNILSSETVQIISCYSSLFNLSPSQMDQLTYLAHCANEYGLLGSGINTRLSILSCLHIIQRQSKMAASLRLVSVSIFKF
jgi:hypothetical protein